MLRKRFIINASGSITTSIGANLLTSSLFKNIPNIKSLPTSEKKNPPQKKQSVLSDTLLLALKILKQLLFLTQIRSNLNMTNFGNYIRDNRNRKKWTQTELGARLGINSSAISKIENGSKILSKKKLNLLSQIFRVPIQEVKDLYYAEKFTNELIENNCTIKVIEKMQLFNTTLKQSK